MTMSVRLSVRPPVRPSVCLSVTTRQSCKCEACTKTTKSINEREKLKQEAKLSLG